MRTSVKSSVARQPRAEVQLLRLASRKEIMQYKVALYIACQNSVNELARRRSKKKEKKKEKLKVQRWKGLDGPIQTHSYCADSSVTSAKLLKKAIVRKTVTLVHQPELAA